MQAFITLLIVPFMIFNIFGGIVSGIWLAILGDWWAIGYGVAGMLLSHFFLAILLMPGLLLAAPAMYFLNKGITLLAAPFVLLGSLYTASLISGWCLFIFGFFLSRADYDNYFPLLIWSYGVALGPWMYLAKKEMQSGSSGGEMISIFFAQIAYIVIAISAVFFSSDVILLSVIFVCIMGVGLLIQFASAFAEIRKRKQMGMM